MRGIFERVMRPGRLQNLIRLSHYAFSFSLVAYIVVLWVESVSVGGLSAIFDPNYLLLIVLATGIISVFTTKSEELGQREPLSKRTYVLITALGIAVAVIVWYSTQGFGAFSFFVSGATGTIAALVSILLVKQEK